MASIVRYRKYVDALITRTLRLPQAPDGRETLGQELAELDDGYTYVSLPDGAVLPPEQPAEIAASIEPVARDPVLREELKVASPHVRLINQRVRERIAARYTVEEEIKLLRTAPSVEFEAYNAYAEDCRAWGRAEKAKLGL
jgi:hypothetical protein